MSKSFAKSFNLESCVPSPTIVSTKSIPFWFKMANDFKIISWRYSGNKERVTMAQIFSGLAVF